MRRRKIIQLTTGQVRSIWCPDVKPDAENPEYKSVLFALCDDGTIWLTHEDGSGNWLEVKGVPQPNEDYGS